MKRFIYHRWSLRSPPIPQTRIRKLVYSWRLVRQQPTVASPASLRHTKKYAPLSLVPGQRTTKYSTITLLPLLVKFSRLENGSFPMIQ